MPEGRPYPHKVEAAAAIRKHTDTTASKHSISRVQQEQNDREAKRNSERAVFKMG